MLAPSEKLDCDGYVLLLQLHSRLHRLEQERRAMDDEHMEQYAQAVALSQLRRSMPGAHPGSKAAQPDASQVTENISKSVL